MDDAISIETLQTQIEDMLLLAEIPLKKGYVREMTNEDCVIPHLTKIFLLKHDLMKRINFNDQAANTVSKIA